MISLVCLHKPVDNSFKFSNTDGQNTRKSRLSLRIRSHKQTTNIHNNTEGPQRTLNCISAQD